MPPYVGMARKQNGGYNASIGVQTADISPGGDNSTRLETVKISSLVISQLKG